jgi:hypothetical protein
MIGYSTGVSGLLMRLWLSKPLYELLPYFYMVGGAFSLAASLYLNYWYWPAVCLVAGFVLIIGGLLIWLRRRDFRQNRGPPNLEEIE